MKHPKSPLFIVFYGIFCVLLANCGQRKSLSIVPNDNSVATIKEQEPLSGTVPLSPTPVPHAQAASQLTSFNYDSFKSSYSAVPAVIATRVVNSAVPLSGERCEASMFIRTSDNLTVGMCLSQEIAPQGALMNGQICGSGRVSGNPGCANPLVGHDCSSSEFSVDRWGCTRVVNSNGDSDCLPGKIRIPISANLAYFACIEPEPLPVIPSSVYPKLRKGDVCGGARQAGKTFSVPGINDCTIHGTLDNSCDRWGCAIMKDSVTGDSDCPPFTQKIMTSDDPTYFICRMSK